MTSEKIEALAYLWVNNIRAANEAQQEILRSPPKFAQHFYGALMTELDSNRELNADVMRNVQDLLNKLCEDIHKGEAA